MLHFRRHLLSNCSEGLAGEAQDLEFHAARQNLWRQASEDIQAAIASGADAIGLNFVAKSPRFVGDLATAHALMQPSRSSKPLWCGVFVNASLDEITAAQETLKLDVIQLHGDESPNLRRV